jgi:hypothetical protein
VSKELIESVIAEEEENSDDYYDELRTSPHPNSYVKA